MPARFSRSARVVNVPAFQPLHFLRRLEARVPRFAFHADTRAAWKRWRTDLRHALAEAIGLERIQTGSLRIKAGPVTPCGPCRCRSFVIETAPGLAVPACLLVPAGLERPAPAILCCHGHGSGMNALLGLTEDGRPRRRGAGYQHDFALQAVRAGFVTLAFDQLGFGRRRDLAFNRRQRFANACEQPSRNALHFGLSMTGLRVRDAIRMLDFLGKCPEVDPRRIGAVGISGGGLVVQFAAALDDRIRAACVSGYCNRFADSILAIRHCIDNYVPGLGLLADNDDIACLIAPRPLLVQSGKRDPIFPIAATRAALAKLGRCYRLVRAGRNLQKDLFDGGHRFRNPPVWAFFRRHLA